jgi:hygromycin-B 7''-O-kinase
MSKRLPATGPDGTYVRPAAESVDSWLPGIGEIAARHGVRADSISRFPRGESPVFEVNGQLVVKLLPRRHAHLATREAESLEWLAGQTNLPLPTVLGFGDLEDWRYLLSTKLPGQSLAGCWTQLPPKGQEAVATELGRILATLHDVPLGDFRPGDIRWEDFLTRGAASWSRRPGVAGLPSRLRESGPDFLARALLDRPADRRVFLHGDLAPENCLVSNAGGSWRVSGIFDLGNAMAGHGPFDLTALTVLLAPGNAATLRHVLNGYGGARDPGPAMASLLMAYTLLHPLGDIAAVLGLIPGLDRSSSWEDVAEQFWPAVALS